QQQQQQQQQQGNKNKKKTKQPLLPKLELPETELQLKPLTWVPNPETAKLASTFAPQHQADGAGHSVYCSQCTTFYASPAEFYSHIGACE
ncbi:hypothetical protein H4R18_005622, partial [Coemansia javaensis]